MDDINDSSFLFSSLPFLGKFQNFFQKNKLSPPPPPQQKSPNSCVKLLLGVFFFPILLKLTLCSPQRHWNSLLLGMEYSSWKGPSKNIQSRSFLYRKGKLARPPLLIRGETEAPQGQGLTLCFQCLSSTMPGTQKTFNRYLLDKQMT